MTEQELEPVIGVYGLRTFRASLVTPDNSLMPSRRRQVLSWRSARVPHGCTGEDPPPECAGLRGSLPVLGDQHDQRRGENEQP